MYIYLIVKIRESFHRQLLVVDFVIIGYRLKILVNTGAPAKLNV